MKLVIQIPCLNERDHLGDTLADLPRSIPGVDAIEVLIVDDGSVDGTAQKAEELGVHHVVRFRSNRGLASAFMAGIDASLRVGADIIVNTDADNQYKGDDIPRLVAPILAGRADMVVGDRQTDAIAHFSWLKKILQRWGSGLVRKISGTSIADTTSGFRAYSRNAATRLFVHNRFSYTLETIVQAGAMRLAVEDLKIVTNPKTRESRLFKSIPQYLARNGPVIFRTYAMYRPVQSFGAVALALFAGGAAMVGRFGYFYLKDPSYSGYTQSLVLGVGLVILAFMVAMFAMLGDLLAANRRYLEEVAERLRRIEARTAGNGERSPDGIHTTAARPWTPGGDAP